MSYQVLARKWRPRVFGELVGQEHVVRALVNALDNDRLHHAYLFTGTRGVGKTTLARIFAKSLNCEQGVGSEPCGQCGVCREVDEGRFIDLLEVDAASRTKVDQTRELLENVPYAPVRGRYKVYLIDEVHMFSGGSFNALLKTLEEPPPHVKFLLATTDPQKVPLTVLSRCLQFNLKRLPLEEIRDYLKLILEKEGLAYELPALGLLARGAEGSMRDALSLMDQAIAFGGGSVMETGVRTMLGASARDAVHGLLQRLVEGDPGGLLQESASLAETAPDFSGVLKDLLALLHRVALAQMVPGSVDDSAGDAEQIGALASRLDPADVQLFYQIGLIGQRDLPLAPDPRAGFEMVLLRMLTFRPESEGGGWTAPTQSGSTVAGRKRGDRPTATDRSGRPDASTRQEAEERPSGIAPPPGEGVLRPGEGLELSHWHKLVESLKIGGIARQLAKNCVCEHWDGSVLKLRLDPDHRQMRVERSEQRLGAALEEALGMPVRLRIEVGELSGESHTPAQREAKDQAAHQRTIEAEMEADSLVRAMQERFAARILPGSIKPVDD